MAESVIKLQTDLITTISLGSIDDLEPYSDGSKRIYKMVARNVTGYPSDGIAGNYPLLLESFKIYGYTKQILHAYSSDGTIKLYMRQQYYSSGGNIYGSWSRIDVTTI